METSRGRVLVIDDEPAVARVLQAFLFKAGFAVETAASAEEAEERLAREEFEVIVADILLPGRSGIEFLKMMRGMGIEAPVVMITGDPSLESAIHAIQEGAYDFLVKPVQTEHLVHTVARGAEKSRLQREKRRLEEENRIYQRELESQNLRLEEKVQERTRELSDYIEELHRMQRLLIQSEKLASLGQLTAGMAHEINNPLAFAKSNLGRIKEYSEAVTRFLGAARAGMSALGKSSDLPAREVAASLQAQAQDLDLDYILADCEAIVRETLEGVERAVAIVRDLRQFSHPCAEEEQECDLHEILESALTLTLPGLKGRTQVIREYGDLPKIMGSPRLLSQVFINLLINAGQALAGPGWIRVRTSRQGDQVAVAIQDNGRGIAPAILPRIFDPFFTTKEVGQGTGLGLSISYGIVREHQGTIEAQSEPGQGATFTVSLPIRRSSVSLETPNDSSLQDRLPPPPAG